MQTWLNNSEEKKRLTPIWWVGNDGKFPRTFLTGTGGGFPTDGQESREKKKAMNSGNCNIRGNKHDNWLPWFVSQIQWSSWMQWTQINNLTCISSWNNHLMGMI